MLVEVLPAAATKIWPCRPAFWIASCRVVLKPPPQDPLSALMLAQLVQQAGWPDGALNVIPLSNEDAAPLITDERIKLLSFTGSSAVGCEVMRAAGDAMKRLLLECGWKSASIVLDDAEVTDEMLRQVLFDSCSLHAGQACILHSRLLLPDSLHDDVVDRLVALARDVKVGDPKDPDAQMGPLISAAQRARVQALVDGAVNDGAKLATGGGRPAGLDVG